jgi:hypothetical protein
MDVDHDTCAECGRTLRDDQSGLCARCFEISIGLSADDDEEDE